MAVSSAVTAGDTVLATHYNNLRTDVVGLDTATFSGAITVASMTTTQRNALSAADGMIIYNTTDNKFQGRANGSWVNFH